MLMHHNALRRRVWDFSNDVPTKTPPRRCTRLHPIRRSEARRVSGLLGPTSLPSFLQRVRLISLGERTQPVWGRFTWWVWAVGYSVVGSFWPALRTCQFGLMLYR